jgi:hypothetical protein
MKFIHFPTFLISLAIGTFMVYMIQPNKKEIYVFPNPENIDKIDFKDKTDTCFGFEEEEVSCPQDMEQVEKYWVQ